MLRSLVGSEMCIRDSNGKPRPIVLAYLGRIEDILSKLGGEKKIELSSRCLLYTSDAADDLLCVDLGGRRILKKKKNNTHQPTQRTNTPSPCTNQPSLNRP